MASVIYVWSGHTNFGGSTLLIDAVVRRLNEAGIPATFHGESEWFTKLSPYNKAEPLPPLTEDDVFVGHLYRLRRRPPVKKALLILHEDREFPLSRKTAGGYDIVVFSSPNHEKKVRARQRYDRPGVIIPNILEVDFTWRPPKTKAAGIIGTVCARKATHVSIQKALEAGYENVYLYGNTDPIYFEEFVKPLLSEKVQFKGLTDDKKQMYNSVSEVFHYSTEEQACVVLGECKKLGIPFHCSEAVED